VVELTLVYCRYNELVFMVVVNHGLYTNVHITFGGPSCIIGCGFVGKIFTGNHGCSHEIWGNPVKFPVNLSDEPKDFTTKNADFTGKNDDFTSDNEDQKNTNMLNLPA
jgi:hypothetical protein